MAKPKKETAVPWNETICDMSDCDVIANLIRRVVVKRKAEDVAKDLMAEFGSFARIIDATHKELKQIDGMGDAACSVITLLPAFYRKYSMSKIKKGTTFDGIEELGMFICNCMAGRRDEALLVVCFNEKMKLISWKVIHEGSIHSVDISMRKIMSYALDEEAAHVVIAHNHIDGILNPSDEDFETTNAIFNALESLKIVLDDHFITCRNEYASLARLSGGTLKPGNKE